MTNPEIQYVNYGVASRCGDVIELHEDLKSYPELHDAILNHELEHTNKNFSAKDFWHDVWPTDKVNRWQLFKFWIVRPRCWINLLPFYWTPKKGFVIDLNRTIMYGIAIGVIAIYIFWIIKLTGGV